MRNLKRALSLALASVMLLGMMVVGTSAASYTDIDENDNVEAIEVLNAVNVMIGRQGNFEPDELVNRHEMAVIMAKLVLGVDTADSYVGSHPFTDVVPWADKYVAACYENGLVVGTSATTYGGGNPLTAVQAAAMMLRALGYKDLNKGYQGDWRAPITAMANQIRLFSGVASNPNEKLNRNQVAQLALNTLKSPMVNLKDNTISWTDGDGQIVISGGNREYIVLSSQEAYARAINDVESKGTSASAIGGWTVELGEHLYDGKLRLDDDTDVFLRPARTWQYDGEKIGTYVKEELLRETYSTEVTGKELYNLLTKNTVDNYDFTIAIDGVETKTNSTVLTGFGYFTEGNLVNTNTRGVGATGKGVTTEVYVDSVNEEVTIAVINTYLAKASENYNEKRDEVRFNIWAVDAKNRDILVKDKAANTVRTVSAEDFGDDVKDFKKNDIVLVRVADNAIQEIIQPEVIDKTTLSSFSKGSWVNNGTKYDYANTAKYDAGVLDEYSKPNMKEVTYNLYLDTYGYMIGIERNSDPDQYVFLTGIDAGTSNLKASTADANIIHVDGTMETVKVDMNKSKNAAGNGLLDGNTKNLSQLNTWCKYAVSTSGVYTLTEITYNAGAGKLGQYAQDVALARQSDTANKKSITEKRTSLVASDDGTSVTSWVYGNDDTKYINVELKDVLVKDSANDNNYLPVKTEYRWIIDDVDTVITGIKDVDLEMTNLPTVKANNKGVDFINPEAEIYTLYKEGIVIAAVTIGEDNGSAATWAYITSEEPRQEDYYHETDSSKAAKPGEWTWYREAIVDGKIVDLIEIGDTLSWIGDETLEGNMQQGEWYEVKLDADGHVRKAQPLSVALAGTGRYVTTSEGVEPAVNANSGDVVLHMTFDKANYNAQQDTLRFKNGNLYTYWNDPKGFSVNRSVNVALGQAQIKKGYADTDANHGVNVDEWKYKDDTFEGYDGVKAAIDRLDANFVGDLNVIFHNGAATVVVINDIWGEFINEGDSGNTGSSKAISLTREANGEWTLVVPYNTTTAQMKDPDMIRAWLTDRGCTDIEAVGGTWTFYRYGNPYRYQTVNVVRETPPTTWTVTINTVKDGVTDTKVETYADGASVDVKYPVVSGYTATIAKDGTPVTAILDGNQYVYTFKVTADTTFTVTYEEDEDNIDPAPEKIEGYKYTSRFEFAGMWWYIYTATDGSGKQITRQYPMNKMARMASVPGNVDLETEGSRTLLMVGDKVFLDLIVDSEGNLVVNAIDPSAVAGDYDKTLEAVKAAAGVTGALTTKFTAGADGADNALSFDLGAPIVGAKLPDTIDIDGKVTAEITWTGDTNNNGIADEGETFSYTATLKAAADVTGKTVVTTQNGAQEAIEADAFKAGVDVNDKGEIDSSNNNTDSDLPVVVVGDKTITAYWYNEDKTVTKPTEKDLKRIETEICSDEAFAEAKDIRCGNLDVGSVIVDGVSYKVTFVRCYTITVGETTIYAYGSNALISKEVAETFVGKNFVTEDPDKVVYDEAVTFGEPADGVSTMTGLTFGTGKNEKAENVTLTTAYELACAENTIYAGTSYDSAAVAATGNYVADKATLYVKFTTDAANQFARLNATVDGKPVMVVEKAYAEQETAGNRVEFTIDAAKYLDAKTNKITLAVVKGYKLIIDDGSTTGIDLGLWDGNAATSTGALTIDYTDTLKKDMSLVVLVADDENGNPVAVDHLAVGSNDSITVAINSVDTAGGTNGWKFDISEDVANTLKDTADEGVITLSRAWKLTLKDGETKIASVTIGDDKEATNIGENGEWVKVGTTVVVETAKEAGLCIADGAGKILSDAMATAEAAATFEGELTADTEFSTLTGTASLTVEKVNELINEKGATEVAAIALGNESGSFADATVKVYKQTGDQAEAEVKESVTIATGDKVKVVVTLTAKDAHTLAFLDEVVVAGFADDKCTVAIADGESGAKVATITFTAAAAKDEYAPAK